MLEVFARELATAEILSVWSYFSASDCERPSTLLSEASLMERLCKSPAPGLVNKWAVFFHSAGSYTLVYTIIQAALQLSAATVMHRCLQTVYALLNFRC